MRRVAALASIVVAAIALSGCGAIVSLAQPRPDDLSQWSRVPLAPDPALTTKAQAACGRGGAPNAQQPLPLLFQDRRTPMSAIVVFGDDNEFQLCTVSHGGGGGFGSGGSEIGAAPRPLTIESGNGRIGETDVTVVDGKVSVPVATLVVVRADGVLVQATAGGGRWAAWWPGDVRAVRAIAIDAAGAELARVEAGQ